MPKGVPLIPGGPDPNQLVRRLRRGRMDVHPAARVVFIDWLYMMAERFAAMRSEADARSRRSRFPGDRELVAKNGSLFDACCVLIEHLRYPFPAAEWHAAAAAVADILEAAGGQDTDPAVN